jgi:DNA polymerase-3 subunit delta
MTPEQFLDRLSKARTGPASSVVRANSSVGSESVYLFLGPESYNRERCRRALIEAALDPSLPPEEREAGFTRHDLDQVPLASALDDARSLSLFATRRVIWLARAESALPRGKSIEAPAGEEEDSAGSGGAAAALASYLRHPTPGTVVVIDAARFEFDGEDKARLERVRKFYSAVPVPAQVEFRPFSPEAVRALAQSLARASGLQLGLAELALLIDATGGDASRIAVEIEKLKLLAGSRKVTADDIAALVPNAQAATIFALVAALGRGDRSRALETLDTLSRAGEYMPLALTFLATQFRMALAAREAGLRGAGEIQAHFSKLGARIWPERAREIGQTMEAFPKARLERAVVKLFEADRDLRGAHPDDRIVMEEMILELTAR